MVRGSGAWWARTVGGGCEDRGYAIDILMEAMRCKKKIRRETCGTSFFRADRRNNLVGS